MRVMTLQAPMGFDHITEEEREIPSPGAGEILVRVHASSLNYHDYLVARGMQQHSEGLVLMSDGSGEVIEVGEGVTEFSVGDHVISTFFPDWLSGDPDARFSGVAGGSMAAVPGDTIDGFAAEYVAKPATSFTKAPQGYTHPEAATLVCAGLTAWRGLIVEGQVKQGDTVLVQGTGGVSIFALQFAKAAGATVIATSSSNEKLERLKAMGADHVINYKETPDWGVEARKLTGGLGVDHVIEIGGAGTLTQSIMATRMGGHIALIGVVAGFTGEVPVAAIFASQLRITGITVGTRSQQEDMVRAIEASGMKPIVDKIFPLEGLADAFRYQETGQHFGKICLEF